MKKNGNRIFFMTALASFFALAIIGAGGARTESLRGVSAPEYAVLGVLGGRDALAVTLSTEEAVVFRSGPFGTIAANGYRRFAEICDRYGPERGTITGDTVTSAAAKGDIAKVRRLIAKGMGDDSVEVLSEALLVAVSAKRMELSKTLIAAGADVNRTGTMGMTPLICATSSYELEMTRMLLEKGADINGRNSYGMTALMCAAGKNDYETVKFLIEKGAGLDVQADGNGINAVMVATGKGYWRIVELLARSGADVNAKAYNGRTALMLAEEFKYDSIVKILKDAGAKR